jgi:hypothetical protein
MISNAPRTIEPKPHGADLGCDDPSMDNDPDPQARKFWRFIAILFALSALSYLVAWHTASG